MIQFLRGFPGGLVVKNPPANAKDAGLIPGCERSPGGGQGNPLQYSCLENSHGQRSLAGYSHQIANSHQTQLKSAKHSTGRP